MKKLGRPRCIWHPLDCRLSGRHEGQCWTGKLNPSEFLIALRSLQSEIDCRIEYGAESGGHLEYVRARLTLIMKGY